MSGFVPTHGPHCLTRTYPTKFPDCSARVFFFSCSCESAVFFECLGHPWRIHECPAHHYAKLRRHGQSARRAEFDTLIRQERHGRRVPEHVAESMRRDVKVEDARRQSPKRTLYLDVLPEEPCDFPGTLMSVERNINMPKQFGLQSNATARQLLGRLGRGRWHRIRVRGHREEGQEVVPEVHAFIPARTLAELGLGEGRRILVSVEPYAPPGRDPVWVATQTTVR